MAQGTMNELNHDVLRAALGGLGFTVQQHSWGLSCIRDGYRVGIDGRGLICDAGTPITERQIRQAYAREIAKQCREMNAAVVQ